jgi:hypothetical protein
MELFRAEVFLHLGIAEHHPSNAKSILVAAVEESELSVRCNE